MNKPGRNQDEDFAKLLAGYHPKTGKALVQNAGEAGRCMAVDLTFSPRKEYSLAFIAASPAEREQMTQAFHRARDKALELITGGLNTRAGKGGQRHVGIEGLLVRSVDHIDSRSGDPQWHCHAVVANVALDKDGQFRSVDFRDLMRTTGSLQEAAQEVFARELAEGFMAMGFGIERQRVLDEDERDTGKVANKIAGIDQSTCEAFSTRRAQIKEGMAQAEAEGRITDATTVAKATRAAKHMSASEIIVEARQRLEELAALTPGHFTKAADLKGKDSVELEKQKSPLAWFDELHAMDSHWNRSALIAKLARELPLGTGIDITAEADRLLAEWEENGTIIRLRDDESLKQARWCSRDQWFLELTVLPAAKKRAEEQDIRLPRSAVYLAIQEHEAAMSAKLGKPVQLSDEQKASVFHVASETGGLACIIGQAGTGKSASAGAYVRAFKAAGRRVIGTSTSQAATDNLRKEAEIEGKNTAELLHALDKGKLTLTANDVVVLDEAGMVGAKTFRRIQKHVDKAGAKLIAVGDPKQLEAIEAGGPFAQLCEKFGAASITQIMRQRNAQERELAEAFYDENKTGANIVEEMLAKGMLRKEKHQVKALAKAYLDDERAVQDKLIVVHTHADASAVDSYVRKGLKERGQLAERSAKTLALGSGEYRRELEVCIGERIRFQKNDRKDKGGKRRWNNNDIGTVVSFKRATSKRGLTLVVKLDDGRTVDVDTEQFQRFGYAYARTAHSAQGLGAESVYWLARGGMIDRNAGLVAMTRTKSNFHAFASPDEVEKLASALDEWGKKETVMELARRRNKPAVARELDQPLVAPEQDAPLATDKAQKVREQQEAQVQAQVQQIKRAGQDLAQAMEQWKAKCDEERNVAWSQLEQLTHPDGDIARFQALAEDEDPYMRAALERKHDKAVRRVKQIEQRLAVLNPQTEADKRKAKAELEDWLDTFYIGGAQAARRDQKLRHEKPRVVSFRQVMLARRQAALAREQIQQVSSGYGPREAEQSDEQTLLNRVRERAQRRNGTDPGTLSSRQERVARLHAELESLTVRSGQRQEQEARRRYREATRMWNAVQDEEREQVQQDLLRAEGKHREMLRERLAVLDGASPEHQARRRHEKLAWIEQHYQGGVAQVQADRALVEAVKGRAKTVVLGQDTDTSFEEIDWETSRFPQRPTRIDPAAMGRPGRNPDPPPRRRPGMLPTQPSLPTMPRPPRPKGWDMEM